MKKTGIVLSGGGVRGFAHLGFLKLLDEIGLKPYAISGVSAGAIVGALYLAGLSPEAVLAVLKKNGYFGWSNLLWRKDGFFSMKPLVNTLQQYVPQNRFEDLSARFFVTATDFTHARAVTFSSGPLYQPVIASASVPVIFAPVTIDDCLLVDGGLLNNLPVEPLIPVCDHIIGCHVNKIHSDQMQSPLGKLNILEKCFHMAIAGTVESRLSQCILYTEPDLHQFNMFDVKKADEIFDIGYASAVRLRSQLEELLLQD